MEFFGPPTELRATQQAQDGLVRQDRHRSRCHGVDGEPTAVGEHRLAGCSALRLGILGGDERQFLLVAR
ncbi:hypothetical protein [Streptomyces sp. NBC_00576]|uniref:hypothetical protein n=1 Tax=Streptomyces sp. NBC_00576 TaxID=2903665 RepID=UPI002E80224B|nr:hypothetical protein [Streptomyces sp. NBC_00576]WUB73236.1 hypothetical protein OG734_25900 [Streptomyces sp. NBC_00576]